MATPQFKIFLFFIGHDDVNKTRSVLLMDKTFEKKEIASFRLIDIDEVIFSFLVIYTDYQLLTEITWIDSFTYFTLERFPIVREKLWT